MHCQNTECNNNTRVDTDPHLLFKQASGLGPANKRTTYWRVASQRVNWWVCEAIIESLVRERSNEWGTTFLLSESSQQPTGVLFGSRWSRCIRARSVTTYRCIDNQFEPTVAREIHHKQWSAGLLRGFVIDKWVGKICTICCDTSAKCLCVWCLMLSPSLVPGDYTDLFLNPGKHSVTRSARLSIRIFYKEYCHSQRVLCWMLKMNFGCECENEILTMGGNISSLTDWWIWIYDYRQQ